MDKNNIPINKGHFDLDTEERVKNFQCIMAEGWEKEYREYRRLWEELPKKFKVREWPLLVDLELSSICNLSCPMCPTITEAFKRDRWKGFMDFDLIKKIIDEVARHIYSLRVSWVGESTLHPQFIEAVKYAKFKGIPEVSTLTNCSKMSPEFIEQIIDSGIDWISISIDGIGEDYEKVRKPLKFNDTLEKLKLIKRIKDERGISKPVIKVQGVWPAIRPDPTLYYETLAPYVDLLAYNPLIDYLRKDSDVVYDENFICSQLYQRVTVASDGRVLLCANDEYADNVIADANEQTIYEIWHGEKLNKIRSLHKEKNGFLKMDGCKHCYYPRKMAVDEKAFVGDREVLIENYINRKQEIGE